MKKMLCLLLLAASGCYYHGYAVRQVPSDPPLSREEVERLVGAGVSEPVVAEMVEKRGAAPLSPDDLVALKKAGVSDPIVQKMIESERKAPKIVVDDYYSYYPSYYYDYYPYYYYPHAYAGFYYGYGWGWGYRSSTRGSFGVRGYR